MSRLAHVAVALALVAEVGAATAIAQTDSAVVASELVRALAAGQFTAVVDQFNDKMRAALPEERLRVTWGSVITQAGMFIRQEPARTTSQGEYRIAIVPCEFERAKLDVQVAFDANARVAGLSIRPAAPTTPFTDAGYVDASRFTERDVVVDAGGWPLPGTIAMPNGAGPWPAVVLVHGSGPGDRDGTVGPNKVFRDLAHGLASRGVAVLRYDKRTRVHAARVAPLRTFTVKDEVIDDAVAAVRWLAAAPGIDSRRVVVAGHSLGGMLAPRVASAANGAVGGLVILAGAVRSLEQSIVDQTRYLAEVDGAIAPEEQQQIEAMQQLAARIAMLRPDDPPVVAGPIAAPASYFIDLRGYDPPAAAAGVSVPMLVVQGGRDYQVTMADFGRWRSALGSRPDVSFLDVPALNHLLMSGTGPSTPAEYAIAGHVDLSVVEAIARWVEQLRR